MSLIHPQFIHFDTIQTDIIIITQMIKIFGYFKQVLCTMFHDRLFRSLSRVNDARNIHRWLPRGSQKMVQHERTLIKLRACPSGIRKLAYNREWEGKKKERKKKGKEERSRCTDLSLALMGSGWIRVEKSLPTSHLSPRYHHTSSSFFASRFGG